MFKSAISKQRDASPGKLGRMTPARDWSARDKAEPCHARTNFTFKILRQMGMVCLAAGIGAVAMSTTARAASTIAGDGVMVLKNLTVPRGGVWLNGALGGHYWQPDSALGICRVDPTPGVVPPNVVNVCNATAKSGGQALVAQPRDASGNPVTTVNNIPGAQYVFVPDASSKSTNVVRFVFDPRNETLGSPSTITVNNPTAVGGGRGGGRPIAAVLAPNGRDVYIAYLKSGDIMKVPNAVTNSVGVPVKVGSTSDGRGVNAALMFGNDLYLAEIGGNGFSKIPDPSGVTRAACSSSAPCTATTVPGLPSFPGGLATDGTYIYVGDAPLTTQGSILRWDPNDNTSNALKTYSADVPPYTATPDGVTQKTYDQFVGPVGLALSPTGDLYVADDPSFAAAVATPPTIQGHLWKVAPAAVALTVTGVSPNSGSTVGGDLVTITGTGFEPGNTMVNFVTVSSSTFATSVNCTRNLCTAVTPPSPLSSTDPTTGAVIQTGTVDIQVVVGSQTSPITPADQFTYVAPPPPPTGAPSITSVSPTRGIPDGGTLVTITGSSLTGTAQTVITFGPNPANSVNCSTDGTRCTAVSPGGKGTVDIQANVDGRLSPLTPSSTAPGAPSDRFTFTTPAANLFAWGITAPKGGMLFVPGNLGGHFWSSDHSAGFCRQDAVPGTSLHAINSAVCDDGSIGSPGQAVYDPTVNPDGSHYIYVPDNAVKSTAVWRLTFNPVTETLVGGPEAMLPLADVRTLKPNGMALGPDGNLYVSDLTEPNIRKITGPNGDPRLQTVSIVAVTGDGRGANGTMGFIGNKLYISENRAASWIDITQCPGNPTPVGACATTPLPLPSGVFVAGVATDPVHNMVYAADSPGGAPATIYRYNLTTMTTAVYVPASTGRVPTGANATVYCSLTCTRPFDPNLTPGGLAGFSFAFGLNVDTTDGSLYVTEDPLAGARGGRGRAWVVPYVP